MKSESEKSNNKNGNAIRKSVHFERKKKFFSPSRLPHRRVENIMPHCLMGLSASQVKEQKKFNIMLMCLWLFETEEKEICVCVLKAQPKVITLLCFLPLAVTCYNFNNFSSHCQIYMLSLFTFNLLESYCRWGCVFHFFSTLNK